MRGVARRLAGLAVALLVAGCNGAEIAGEPTPNSAGSAVGQNLVGEACRAAVRNDAAVDPDAPPPLNIVCGTGKGVAGVVHTAFLSLSVPGSGPSRRAAIERAAAQSPAALGIAARMSCRPGHWLPAQSGAAKDGSAGDGDEILVAPCFLNEGGWPQIVVTAPIGKTLYQAEGLPSLMPVFVAAINASSGRKLDIGEAGTSIAALETVLNSKLPSFGSGDLSEYNELMRAARVYNAGRNSAEAENSYRRALEIQTRVFGASSPGAGEALVALALEVSNQGRFEEAANLFRRAEPIIERSPNVMDRARRARSQPEHRGRDGAPPRRSVDRRGERPGSVADHQRHAGPAAVVAAQRAVDDGADQRAARPLLRRRAQLSRRAGLSPAPVRGYRADGARRSGARPALCR